MPGVGPGPLSPPPPVPDAPRGELKGTESLLQGREQHPGPWPGTSSGQPGRGGVWRTASQGGSSWVPRGPTRCVPLTEEPLAPFGPGGPCGERGQSVISEQAASSPPDTRF